MEENYNPDRVVKVSKILIRPLVGETGRERGRVLLEHRIEFTPSVSFYR